MAIDRVLHLELAFPLSRRDEVLRVLHAAGIAHLDEASEELLGAGADRGSVSTDYVDARIAPLSAAVEVIEQHSLAPRKTLVESFFSVSPPATRTELTDAGRNLDFESIGKLAGKLRDRWRQLVKFESEAQAELAALRPFAGLSFNARDIERLKTVSALFGQMTSDRFNDLRLDPAAEMLAWEEIRREKGRVWVLAAFRPVEAEAAQAKLREHGFEEVALPRLAKPVEERIAALHKDLERADQEKAEVRSEAGKLASDYPAIVRALAFWEDQRELRLAAARSAEVGRIGALTGWIRERDRAALEKLLAERMPWASAELRPPNLQDDPPVSIRLPGLLRPMQLLINMFGMPDYRSFDPTPYLTLSFLVFFGCCFGDVGYGTMLCIVSFCVVRRYRHSWVKDFFQFFLYAGIAAIVVGLLTGSWFGDLVSSTYLSAENPLVRLRDACMLMDPLKKPLLGLVISLVIGVVNQFYGMFLKFGMELRRRDYAAAFFDAGLWMVFLPGLMLLAVPGAARTVGLTLTIGGGVGLVLTQGRREKGLLAKGITGVVSLYGILGSYGTTSFLSDTLSYSRLLALGMATGILGLSVNLMAGMAKNAPVVGPALFAVIVVGGHLFNFAVSILGAFVHPARLILLEFFNRFYESGGRKFTPLEFSSDKVEIVGSKGA